MKVSIFLKNKVQNSNGRFVLPISGSVSNGTEIPGSVRLFNGDGTQTKVKQFAPGSKFSSTQPDGAVSAHGDRVVKLGTNMHVGIWHNTMSTTSELGYSNTQPLEATVSGQSRAMTSTEAETAAPNPLAKAQLDLLSKLIGGSEKKSSKPMFRLNLFNNDDEEEQAAVMRPQMEEVGSQVVNIDASKKKENAALDRIMGELRVGDAGNTGEDDLLDLMDSAQ